MGRWQPGARERLEQAALDLFLEQGFNETTVPQITARAGLTTRTFFRYFADKREVLFAHEELVPSQVADLMAGAPPSLTPMELITERLAPPQPRSSRVAASKIYYAAAPPSTPNRLCKSVSCANSR